MTARRLRAVSDQAGLRLGSRSEQPDLRAHSSAGSVRVRELGEQVRTGGEQAGSRSEHDAKPVSHGEKPAGIGPIAEQGGISPRTSAIKTKAEPIAEPNATNREPNGSRASVGQQPDDALSNGTGLVHGAGAPCPVRDQAADQVETRLETRLEQSPARYHGRARRGQPSRAEENEFDVRMAIRELEVAHMTYLAILARDPSDSDRRQLMEDARDKARLAAGFIQDVLKRPAK